MRKTARLKEGSPPRDSRRERRNELERKGRAAGGQRALPAPRALTSAPSREGRRVSPSPRRTAPGPGHTCPPQMSFSSSASKGGAAPRSAQLTAPLTASPLLPGSRRRGRGFCSPAWRESLLDQAMPGMCAGRPGSRSGVFPWTLAVGLWKARSRAGRPTQAAGGGTRPPHTPRRPRGPSGLWLRLREEARTLLPGTFFWTLGAELPTSCARPLACVARGGRWRGQRTAPGSRASEPDRSGHLRASRCDQRAVGACRPPPARPAPPWSPGLQGRTRAPATPLACTGHTAQRSLLVPLFHPRAFSKGGGRSEGGFYVLSRRSGPAHGLRGCCHRAGVTVWEPEQASRQGPL